MRRSLVVVLGALAVSAVAVATPARLRAQDISCDPGDREVQSLEFSGNRAFTSSDLKVRIATTESGWWRRHLGLFGTRHCLDRSELPLDVLRLEKFYHDKGYYRTRVDTLVQLIDPDGVRVKFSIDEGPPILVRSLTFSGLDSVPVRDAVLSGLGLTVGMPFDVGRLTAELDSVRTRMRNWGYPNVDLLNNYTINTDSLTAVVQVVVLPGQRARVSAVDIEVTPDSGKSQQIGADVIRKLIGVKPGDLYSDTALVKAQRSLYQLGTYRHVEVSADSLADTDSLVTLRVLLREDKMQSLQTTYGWATLDCFRTSAQYTNTNFLHQARRLEVSLQLSKLGYGYPLATSATRNLCYQDVLRRDPFSDTTNYSISATLTRPGLLGGAWVPQYTIYRERRSQFLAYLRSTLVGGEASVQRAVGSDATLRFAYSLEYGRTQAQPALLCAVFNRCDEQSRSQISRVAQPLAVASGQYTRTTVENPFNPSNGYTFSTELRSSARVLGSTPDLTFNKGTFDVAWYRPVAGATVFAAHLRGGVVVGSNLSLSNPTRYIPPEERLYAGGASSVRGFYQNELGQLLYIAQGYDSVTVDDSTRYFVAPNNVRPFRVVPVGGNALVVANFEYRVPDPFFPNLLQWSFFTDGGEVWTRGTPGTSLAWSQIRWTPGIGIRVFTPVGPLEVNVGYNPYPQPRGPIYYDGSIDQETGVAPLYCVSPGNTIPVHVDATTGNYSQAELTCPSTFSPSQASGFLRRLTFTFSIGTGF